MSSRVRHISFGLRDYGVAGQIGLEATPDEFVRAMVAVFREVWRVLRDDGTCWVNLGDSYSSVGGTGHQGKHGQRCDRRHTQQRLLAPGPASGLKAKDLIGIPWRVAFALQADGWYLRSDVIWHKPNPMPESTRDRPTKAHEYLFLLAKRPSYYYDCDAIAEPATYAGCDRGGSTKRYEQNAAGMDNKRYDTRNKRSVWTVNARPFKGAHFATFPPELITPCIKAGCPEGGTVLDPFGGAFTTAVVAASLGRRSVCTELNPDYCLLGRERLLRALEAAKPKPAKPPKPNPRPPSPVPLTRQTFMFGISEFPGCPE